ncbi:MAG: hypothetical protein WD696_22955 [Bryobacteraceae bacterium]
MRGRRLIPVLLPALLAATAVIDRVAVTVNGQMITLRRIHNDLRITAMLNREPLDLGNGSMRKAAERLIDQALLRREMELTGFPLPKEDEASKVLEQVKAQRFPTETEYRQVLEEYGVTGQMLREYFLWQVAILRFVDFRFSPGILLSESELEKYYRDVFAPEWVRRHGGVPPAMEKVRPQIEQGLKARRTNEALDRWLKAALSRSEIRYHPEVFR